MVTTTQKNTLPSATSSSFATDLQNFLANEDADRLNELAGTGFLISGGLHGTVAGLTGTPSSCVAYPGGYYVAETGSITYPDNKATIWVIISKDQSTSLGGNWVRVSGTNYAYDSTSVSRPALPTACLWLMEVTTASGAISAVTDIRRIARIPTLIHSKTAAPGVNDDDVHGFIVGDVWVDETADESYRCFDTTTGAAVWKGTSGIEGVVNDTTPQLGGDLDVNGNSLVSTSNGDIAITPNGSGSVILDGISHPQADGASGQTLSTNGSGQLAFAYNFHAYYKYGLMLSNDAGDTSHDVQIDTGGCRNYGHTVDMVLSSVLTKQIDAAWSVGDDAGGMDTGSVAASTGYGVYLIRRSDTGVVDALFSTDMSPAGSSVTMPTSYNQKRLIGWVLTDASANIYAFAHSRQGMADKFQIMASPPAVVTDSTITSGTFEAATFPVPPLSTVEIVARSYNATAANDVVVTLKPTDSTESYSGTYAWMALTSSAADLNGINIKSTVLADVSSQISYAANETSGTTTVTLSLLGITLPTLV